MLEHMQAPALPAGTGFLANRLLVAASLGGVLAGFLLVADRMTKAGFSSQADIGAAVAAALGTGIVFQANFRRVVRLVDRVFLPRRYAAAAALDGIRATLRERDSSEPMAGEVAGALGLASVAVFTRTPDGGFVRQAAFGWPLGTVWHLLPGEALTGALEAAAHVVVPIPEGAAIEVALPEAEARPRIAVTRRRRGIVQSAILLGRDMHGSTPDLDTVRGLSALLGELIVA
jgi:hypothetical protein